VCAWIDAFRQYLSIRDWSTRLHIDHSNSHHIFVLCCEQRARGQGKHEYKSSLVVSKETTGPYLARVGLIGHFVKRTYGAKTRIFLKSKIQKMTADSPSGMTNKKSKYNSEGSSELIFVVSAVELGHLGAFA